MTDVIIPKLDEAILTKAHIVLVRLESELRANGRGEEADTLSYVDLLVLVARNTMMQRRPT